MPQSSVGSTERLNTIRQTGGCQRTTSSSICLLVKLRALQIFFVAAIAPVLPATLVRGALSSGAIYPLTFVDINGNKLSTADGHVTVLVVSTTADREKARAVGDRVPDYCLGNPTYRMITIIRFTSRHTVIGRRVATALIRHRVREEAKQLQTRYDSQKIARDPRGDIFVVADFDGTASSQLDGLGEAPTFHVLVFARDGKLLAQWTDVPSAKQLAEVLK
jgi:hypothetical protein